MSGMCTLFSDNMKMKRVFVLFCWYMSVVATYGSDLQITQDKTNTDAHNNIRVMDVYHSNVQSEPSCRFSNYPSFPPDVFSFLACATCYRHMDDLLFLKGLKFTQKGFFLMDPQTNSTYLANISDSSSPIWKSFASEKAEKLWLECCKASDDCCDLMLKTPPFNGTNFCERTWDGWQCWPDTPAGTTTQTSCPWHVYFHSEPRCGGYATKVCHDNGTWFRYDGEKEWSNYTTCALVHDVLVPLYAHIITLGISITLLVPALAIFFHYKQLRAFRVSMHKNLFVSLLINGVFVIIFECYMVDSLKNRKNSLMEMNEVACKGFYTVTKYLRMTNYTWMFCEGFYLHKLIAAAFAEQKSMKIFYLIGWGLPVIPLVVWAALRYKFADEGCWELPSGYYEYVMFIPMLLTLLVNISFLANIIRVLVSKLRRSRTNEPTQFRRAVKATLVLVPLFGIHIILIMINPKGGHCLGVKVYNITSYSIDGLQGAFVAIIFCYLNNEVLYLLKRSYMRHKLLQNIGSTTKRTTVMDTRGSVSTNVSFVDFQNGKRLSE